MAGTFTTRLLHKNCADAEVNDYNEINTRLALATGHCALLQMPGDAEPELRRPSRDVAVGP